MPTFADIEGKSAANVRKGLRAAIFVAPMSSTAITTLTDSSGVLQALPAGYRSLGWNSEDGVSWAREIETSDVTGHGSPEPLRSDIRRSTKRMTVTCQENNIVVLEQYLGMSLASVTTAIGNESSWDEPELPPFNYVRLLAIAKDVHQTATGDYYLAKLFPRARVVETGDQPWTDDDTPVQSELTFQAFMDEAEGTAVRHWLGGPGRVPTGEGFPAPA